MSITDLEEATLVTAMGVDEDLTLPEETIPSIEVDGEDKADDSMVVEGTEGGEEEGEEEEGEEDEAEDDDDDEEEDDDDDEDEEDEEEGDDDDDDDDDDEEGDDDEDEDEDDADESKSAIDVPKGPTFRYPPAVEDISTVSERERKFKFARFLVCTVDGCDCSGLEPPAGSTVVLAVRDEDVPMADADDAASAWRTEEGWWNMCGKCRHGWQGEEGHVVAEDVDDDERRRREKVVGRIEELLQVCVV